MIARPPRGGLGKGLKPWPYQMPAVWLAWSYEGLPWLAWEDCALAIKRYNTRGWDAP